MENLKSDLKARTISISRTLDAPVDMVWELWTNPDHLAQWWGPNGFTTTISRMDIQPGGAWDMVMHGPDGTDYDNKCIFRKVVNQKQIVFEHINWPHFVTTIDFESQGDKTLIHWSMLFESEELLLEVVKQHKADTGLIENMEKFAAYLKTFSAKKK